MTASAVILEIPARCEFCASLKPLSSFKPKKASSKSLGRCVDCRRAYNAKWRKANKEDVKKAAAVWRGRNPEYQKQWAAKNPESKKNSQLRAWEKMRADRALLEDTGLRVKPSQRETSEGRLCGSCRQRKPHTCFGDNLARKDGLRTTCNDCENAKAYTWRTKNREKARQAVFRSHLKRTYNLTESAFAALIQAQGGKCAICRKVLTKEKRGTCVDHNHKTGAVRGVLCRPCNSGIGQFYENEETLMNAITYLRRTNGED